MVSLIRQNISDNVVLCCHFYIGVKDSFPCVRIVQFLLDFEMHKSDFLMFERKTYLIFYNDDKINFTILYIVYATDFFHSF